MLKISLLEFLMRTIPESFLFILTGYLFNFKKIDKNKLYSSSLILAITTYLIRLLPIHYGVHTLINITICILITVNLNKISIIQSITSALFAATALSLCEMINFFILDNILKVDIDAIVINPFMKLFNFTPSLILFGFVIWIVNIIMKKGKKEKNRVTS